MMNSVVSGDGALVSGWPPGVVGGHSTDDQPECWEFTTRTFDSDGGRDRSCSPLRRSRRRVLDTIRPRGAASPAPPMSRGALPVSARRPTRCSGVAFAQMPLPGDVTGTAPAVRDGDDSS
jgi:hypothetical protein